MSVDQLARLAWGGLIIFGLASTLTAQDDGASVAAKPPSVRLSVADAVRLATTHNAALRVRAFEQLIERTRIAEAEAAFEPTAFANGSAGVSEVVFPQIFPSGQFDPNGNPIFQQVIVTDSSVTANWQAGVRGLIPTGATWELSVNTDYRDRESGGLVNPTFNTRSSVTLTQPILRGAWLQYNHAVIRQAEFAESQSRQRFRGQVLDTIFEVNEAYWNHVFAIQDLGVRKRSLDVAERLLAINRVKVETGVFPPIEIVSAESGVATRITEVEIAENQIKETADTLKRLVLPFRDLSEWDTEVVATDSIEPRFWAVPQLADCVKIALEERPDLTEARVVLRSRDLSVATADADALPKFDFVGSANFSGLERDYDDSYLDAFGEKGAESWSLGFQLEVPLGNKAARSRLARSRLERDQSLSNFRNLQLVAVEAVRRAWRDVEISEKTIVSRRRAADLKREELRNEEVKRESKVSTNFQVLQVAEDLSRAESDLARALADYRIALARLARAMGSSLDVLKWPTR